MAYLDPGYASRFVSALETGSRIHLGSYFGNLRLCLESQVRNPRNNFLFIADLHYRSQSGIEDDLIADNRRLIREFMALGINPEHTVLYLQSDIPELLELTWLLCCHCPMQNIIDEEEFKQGYPTVAHSLYPMLMAADVLGVRASTVTVGPDEERHVGFAAKLAKMVNDKCIRPILPAPKRDPRAQEYIPGTNGERMQTSKANAIRVFAEETEIHFAINSIKTTKVKKKEPIDAATDVTFKVLSQFCTQEERAAIQAQYEAADIDHDDAKALLKEKFFKLFDPARERLRELERRPEAVDEFVAAGRHRVRRELRETIHHIRESMR